MLREALQKESAIYIYRPVYNMSLASTNAFFLQAYSHDIKSSDVKHDNMYVVDGLRGLRAAGVLVGLR